jgi:hypothetical protein
VRALLLAPSHRARQCLLPAAKALSVGEAHAHLAAVVHGQVHAHGCRFRWEGQGAAVQLPVAS